MSKKVNVTVSISTRNRYDTTLVACLMSVINQTVTPEELILFDDGDQRDLRNESTYCHVFALMQEKGIDWKVIFGAKKGQVLNHQKAIEIAKHDLIWRFDDDDWAAPDALEKMYNRINSDEKIGAIGSVVWTPGQVKDASAICSGKIEDIVSKANVQWFRHKEEVVEVDHLHNTFLFRKEAMKHGYCKNLSPVGHREETLATYEMKRNGWKILVETGAIVYHLRDNKGGIRSHEGAEMYAADERVFMEKLRQWGVSLSQHIPIVLDCGLGDHIVFKMLLPRILKKHKDKKIILSVCFPDIFWDIDKTNIEIISIADAIQMGIDLEPFNVYRFMTMHNWQRPLIEAFEAIYL